MRSSQKHAAELRIRIPSPGNFRPGHRTRVFDVETDKTGKSIRCALPVCSRHATNDTSTDFIWLENTDENVRRLEKHVGEEIEEWLGRLSSSSSPALAEFVQDVGVQWTCPSPEKCRKQLIFAVLELEDRHASMGPWLYQFLKAVAMRKVPAASSTRDESGSDWAFGVITLPFASRRRLLASIHALQQLRIHDQVHVFILMSTHASSQGQVFACTPSHISREQGDYEEFCSLDNLVLSAQDSLGSALIGIHCSACFLMTLDSSHKDWPCSVSWIKTRLHCAVTGSRGEIFETGSQAADIMTLLLTLHGVLQSATQTTLPGAAKKKKKAVRASQASCLSHVLPDVYRQISQELAPNLAHEMRLVRLCADYVTERMALQEEEAPVHPRPLLLSRVSLVLLTTGDASPAELAAAQLAEAVQLNVAMRSDVRSTVHRLVLQVGSLSKDGALVQQTLTEKVAALDDPQLSYFFVVLSPALCGFADALLKSIKQFQEQQQVMREKGSLASSSSSGNADVGSSAEGSAVLPDMQVIPRRCVYGVYFHSLPDGLLPRCTGEWQRLQPEEPSDQDLLSLPMVAAIERTCSELAVYHQLPLLLYLVHLAVGENCVSLHADAAVPYRPSRWILERVYTEVVMMLSGLACRCGLTLLSPAPIAIEKHCLRYPLPAAVAMKSWKCGLVACESSLVVREEHPFGPASDGAADCSSSSCPQPSLSAEPPVACEEMDVSNTPPTHQTSGQGQAGSSQHGTHTLTKNPQTLQNHGQTMQNPGQTLQNHAQILQNDPQTMCNDAQTLQIDPRTSQTDAGGNNCGVLVKSEQPKSASSCFNSPQGHNVGAGEHKCVLDSASQVLPPASTKTHSASVSTCQEACLAPKASSTLAPASAKPQDSAGLGASPECTPSDVTIKAQEDCEQKASVAGDAGVPASDLPISCNWQEVHVRHYCLDWRVNFDAQQISGHVDYCLAPATDAGSVGGANEVQQYCPCPAGGLIGVSELRLDSFGLKVSEVFGLVPSVSDHVNGDTGSAFPELVSCCAVDSLRWSPLEFCITEHCLSCSKPPTVCCLPRHIRVRYSTSPTGTSLHWARATDSSRRCVFTRGSSVNNRALFPGQDSPRCSSTWRCNVRVPSGCTVCMSGDNCSAEAVGQESLFTCSMSVPLWCCTLAFSAGAFVEVPVQQPDEACHRLPISLWCCDSLREDARSYLGDPSKRLLDVACHLLGAYPFHHLTLVVLPDAMGCLGLANPNMVFLSPSLLTSGDCAGIRLAHEISHSWFGLHIGARIWTEEWLSEGFATYCEDRIDFLLKEMSGGNATHLLELEDIRLRLKLAVLSAELEHTDASLQVLMPSAGSRGTEESVVNALNDQKAFCQVHYIKGYLLLRHLASVVGVTEFDVFLGKVTSKFGGSNITSLELLEFFFESTAAQYRSEDFCPERLVDDWLRCPGMPPISHLVLADDKNQLLRMIDSELQSLLEMVNTPGSHGKQHHHANGVSCDRVWSCYELCYLLSRLVQADVVCFRTCCMRHIRTKFTLASRSAEERHLWCELVVKHRCQAFYGDVETFLTNDQGMGVYLYGELILTRQKRAQKLACDLYRRLQRDMDADARKSVYAMLSPLLG